MPFETNRTSVSGADSSRVANLLESVIRDIGIPPCPALLDKISAEMRKEEPDFKHVTRIISSDVGIAAGLIAIANSPYFGFRSRVRSVNEALMMLGLSVASRAIAGLIVRKLFPLTPSLERFWHASACIARLSGWLVQEAHFVIKIRADDAYTFGLFRDSGIPMMMNRFNQYPEVLREANEDGEQSFTEVEEASCSANHALVGGLLAQSWGLPDDICLAIRHHHDYSQLKQTSQSELSPTTRGLIATALLAEHLFQHHTGLSQTQEWHKGGEICRQLFNLTDEGLERLYEESGPIIASNE